MEDNVGFLHMLASSHGLLPLGLRSLFLLQVRGQWDGGPDCRGPTTGTSPLSPAVWHGQILPLSELQFLHQWKGRRGHEGKWLGELASAPGCWASTASPAAPALRATSSQSPTSAGSGPSSCHLTCTAWFSPASEGATLGLAQNGCSCNGCGTEF